MGMQRSFSLSLLLLFLLAVNLGVLCVSLQDEVSALAAFKQAIYEDPLSVMSDWNTDDKDPCSWSGVICSTPQRRVISLNLSSSSMKGFLAREVGLLSSLQELILTNNLLLGTVPKQIGMLKNLKLLDLSVNRFSGPLHPEIGQLTSITKINLHSNGLTGTLPPELGKLLTLVELHLDRNRFTGSIPTSSKTNYASSTHGMFTSQSNGPGLCKLPRLEFADFSYNFFVGRIPSCLKYLPRSTFQGNCFQDEYSIFQRSSQLCKSSSSKGGTVAKETHKDSDRGLMHQFSHHPEWLLILEISTGALVTIFVITGAMTAVRKYKPKPSVRIPWTKPTNWNDLIAISIDSDMLKNVKRLRRQELEVACEDFSNIIGSSSDSIVYKGTMKDGPEIAVISICISEDHWTSYLEIYFQTQVADLARLNHENIAKLLGYCTESDPFSRMLVFDYASNGTLYEHLHYGDGYQLSWFRRMKISLGIARGLRYLHTELQPPFTICDFNSSAVYLTEDFSPKLVDFDSWKMMFSRSENSGYLTNEGSFNGFMGSLEQQNLDVQGNTFSFGVLLLEIISGKPLYCKDRGNLVDWAMEYLQQPEEIGKLVDPELKDVKADDLAVICSVASLCIDPNPSKRPSMQIISAVLENGIDLSISTLLKESSLCWAELALST